MYDSIGRYEQEELSRVTILDLRKQVSLYQDIAHGANARARWLARRLDEVTDELQRLKTECAKEKASEEHQKNP